MFHSLQPELAAARRQALLDEAARRRCAASIVRRAADAHSSGSRALRFSTTDLHPTPSQLATAAVIVAIVALMVLAAAEVMTLGDGLVVAGIDPKTGKPV